MSAQARAGRNGGRGRGRGGRGRGPSRHRSHQSSVASTKFHGDCPDLKDHIYDCSDYRQADKFHQTSKKLVEYVGREYTYGGDIASSLSNLRIFDIPIPDPPQPDDPTNLTAEDKQMEKLHEKRLEMCLKREMVLMDNIQKSYALILGQSTDLLQTKLKQQTEWDVISTERNGVDLLRLIQQVVYKFEDQKYLPLALYNAKAHLYSFRQGNLPCDEYMKKFTSLVDIATSYEGQIHDTAIRDYVTITEHGDGAEYDALTDIQKLAVDVAAHDLWCATMFLAQCDKRRFGRLTEELENNFTKGRNDYPVDMVRAFAMLNEYKNWQPRSPTIDSSGTAFATKSSRSKSKSDVPDWQKKATCHHCGEVGHIKPNCPKLKDDGDDEKKTIKDEDKKPKSETKKYTLVQLTDEQLNTLKSSAGDDSSVELQGVGFCTTTIKPSDLRWMILLDNQATVDIFCNRALLTKVWTSDGYMTISGNGGELRTNLQGWLPGYGMVWYHKSAITNLLCFKNVLDKGLRITHKVDPVSTFTVQKTDGTMAEFRMQECGLHCYDPRSAAKQFTMVETVQSNEAGYTKKQILGAKKAREFQSIVGHPSTADLRVIIQSNQIANCPVTIDDLDRAEKIYGPSVAIVKGKTVRKTPDAVKTDVVAVPEQILSANKNVTLNGDVFFVNQVPFFATISDNIRLTTALYCKNRTKKQLVSAMGTVVKIYSARGFNVRTAKMDNEFSHMEEDFKDLGLQLQTVAADAHVPKIERQIRVIKERVRATRHTLPFKVLPLLMLVELVYHSVMWLNAFPPKGGVSEILSPRTIITGMTLDAKKHCQLPFGTYVQAHVSAHPTNTPAERTVGAICLGPKGNLSGTYKFMSLRTGKIITPISWTKLPMSQEVIDRVNEMGAADGQPELLTFSDGRGNNFGDFLQDDDQFAGVLDENALHPQMADGDPAVDDGPDGEPDDVPSDTPDLSTDDSDPHIDDDIEAPIADGAFTPNETIGATDTAPVPETTAGKNISSELPSVRRSTRERKPRTILEPTMTGKSHGEKTFASVFIADGEMSGLVPDEHLGHVFHTVMAYTLTQMSMNRGLKMWKTRAVDAIALEMGQLHHRDTFEPKHWSELTDEQKSQVLESHLFLKEKHDKTIKGRMVAGGNKQRGFIDAEDAASPTAALESVLLTAAIDAKEERDVGVLDIPNAFVQTRLEDEKDKAIIRLRGPLADALVQLDPDLYGPYVTKDKKGHSVLYAQIKNALYGIMRAALLYYQRFVRDISSIGFVINPYDPCVANLDVLGSKLTIVWHVDDLKASHKKSQVIDRLSKWLAKMYDEVNVSSSGGGKMKVSRGKQHTYLGMDLDYSKPGEVKVSMSSYVKEIIQQFADHDDSTKPTATVTTPAAEHLFKVDESAESLSPDGKATFHNFVAKCLYLTKRARPDIATAVAFLTTRVKSPDVDDWKKLIRLIRYLRGTPELALTLRVDKEIVVRWWVDGSFAVHPNMRGHSGGCMSLGAGVIAPGSNKQKLNTRSSTESELVAVDDFMASLLWTNNFLRAQGVEVQKTILYQDNQSAILLEKNGRASCSKRTKHLKQFHRPSPT